MESQTALLADAVTARDPGEPIPSCPDWTLRDLVAHVGTGHRYATGMIEREAAQPTPYALIPAPDDPAEWPGWLDAGARGLTAATREHGFDTPVWSWVPRHRTAGFWVRRMLHDLIIHRFDAANGGGDLDPDLAVDGVSDILLCVETVSARPESPMAGLRGAGETLQFSDGEHGWHVTRTPDGVTWRDGTAPADAGYRATALDLLLVLNRRRAPGPCDGDRRLLEHWLEHSRF